MQLSTFTKRLSVLLAVSIPLLLGLSSAPAHGHEVFVLGTTLAKGGQIRIFRFAEREIQVYRVLCQGGQCFHSAQDPGFAGDPGHGGLTAEDLAKEGLFELSESLDVWLEIDDIAPQVQIGFGSTVLQKNGPRKIRLGSGPSLHVHPSWRLILPEGEEGAYPVVFRLTTTAPTYEGSPAYTVWVTNRSQLTPSPSPTSTMTVAPSPTPSQTTIPTHSVARTLSPTASATPSVTPTTTAMQPSPSWTDTPVTEPTTLPTPTPTSSAVPEPCAGDCSGDGSTTVDEIVRGVSILLGLATLDTCPAVDQNNDGEVTVDEIVRAVLVALSGCFT